MLKFVLRMEKYFNFLIMMWLMLSCWKILNSSGKKAIESGKIVRKSPKVEVILEIHFEIRMIKRLIRSSEFPFIRKKVKLEMSHLHNEFKMLLFEAVNEIEGWDTKTYEQLIELLYVK